MSEPSASSSALHPAIGAAAVGIVLLAAWWVFLRRPWPFRVLRRRGVHRSAALPTGDGLEERKRDFARIVAPSAKPGLFVVTPSVALPRPWSSKAHGAAGDVSKEVADAVFEEFSAWVASVVPGATDNLAERVIALVAVSEGFAFAMQSKFPPMFPQSRFVLVVSSGGEVRVVWMAYATDRPRPNLGSTPFILKLATRDLNGQRAAAEAHSTGVQMDYVVVDTAERDLDRYIEARQSAALSRAALEGNWEDVLGSK